MGRPTIRTHIAGADALPDGWHASCSCTWSGPDRLNEKDGRSAYQRALADAEQHTLAAFEAMQR